MNMNHRTRILIAFAVVSLLTLLSTFSTSALSNVTFSPDGTGWTDTDDCNWVNANYNLSGTPTVDDDGGYDYFAVTMVDGNGVVLDVDWWSMLFANGPFISSDYSDFSSVHNITARPVTFSLWDITYPGALDENTDDGYAFASAGTLLASFVLDPAEIAPVCSSLPVVTSSSGIPIPAGSVVGDLPNAIRAYYRPGNLSTVTLNAGTYWVIGVDESGAYYKIILANQYLWVPVESMQPSYQAPQNGAPLPTRVVN